MITRILKVTQTKDKRTFYIPQYSQHGTHWYEFIGYDEDSPYLHPKIFDTKEEAIDFLLGPASIYYPGTHHYGKVTNVT